MAKAKLEVKEEATKVEEVVKPAAAKVAGLTAPLYSLDGKADGKISLPKEIFGAEINEKLIHQALRVYMNNQKGHFGNTKTRGQVEGSTRKIFKQKGTGRARHGSIRANIFVGGGIVFGPKSRNVVLELPHKMKQLALVSALSKKTRDGDIKGVSGIEAATGKTREFAGLFKSFATKSALFITSDKENVAKRATKNLPKVKTLGASEINALEVLRYQSVILTKGAIDILQKRMTGEKNAA